MNNTALEQKINEQEKKIEELLKEKDEMKKSIEEMKSIFEKHSHNGNDGTEKIFGVSGLGQTGDFVELGTGGIAQTNFDNSTSLQEGILISVGKDKTIKYQDSPSKDVDTANLQLAVITNKSTGAYGGSVFAGAAKPFYFNTNKSITSGGNTLTDTTWNWKPSTVSPAYDGELAGCYIAIYDSSFTLLEVKQIASNTASVITIDGTWINTISNCKYQTFNPVILGDSALRWERLNLIGKDISSGGTGAQRLGIGMGLSGLAIGVYYGNGSPEGVVTANIGSLYLRLDGSTSTTLYVKTGAGLVSDTPPFSTGWTAK